MGTLLHVIEGTFDIADVAKVEAEDLNAEGAPGLSVSRVLDAGTGAGSAVSPHEYVEGESSSFAIDVCTGSNTIDLGPLAARMKIVCRRD
jgi:hypothetical protein